MPSIVGTVSTAINTVASGHPDVTGHIVPTGANVLLAFGTNFASTIRPCTQVTWDPTGQNVNLTSQYNYDGVNNPSGRLFWANATTFTKDAGRNVTSAFTANGSKTLTLVNLSGTTPTSASTLFRDSTLATGSSGSPAVGGLAGTLANDLVLGVCAFGHANNATPTNDAGQTTVANVHNDIVNTTPNQGIHYCASSDDPDADDDFGWTGTASVEWAARATSIIDAAPTALPRGRMMRGMIGR